MSLHDEANQDTRALVTTTSLLPNRSEAQGQLQAVREFQATVRSLFVKGHDYGEIPGMGERPTLLKPGAEKLAKLLRLADTYEIVQSVEDWDRPLFRYLVKCRLIHMESGFLVSEGLGECNSMEAKYRYRWVWPNELTQEERHQLDAMRGYTKTFTSKDGQRTFKKYRVDNDDLYSQVNTILKMAKKRALVDAALSAGRLSDLFTQDLEDLVIDGEYQVMDAEQNGGQSATQGAQRQAQQTQRGRSGQVPNENMVALKSDPKWERWQELVTQAPEYDIRPPKLSLPLPERVLDQSIEALEDAINRKQPKEGGRDEGPATQAEPSAAGQAPAAGNGTLV